MILLAEVIENFEIYSSSFINSILNGYFGEILTIDKLIFVCSFVCLFFPPLFCSFWKTIYF